MKTYFNNFPYTAESLKSEYRELCKKLHPDTGGSEEEFKAMAAEYEKISYDVDVNNRRRQREQEEAEQRRQEEEARRQREEEERRQREEEERREQKAQEESRRKVAEWAQRLERVNNAGRRVWDFADKKAAAAFTATTKRNIKAVINHYFPGLKVKVSISGKIWQEKFSITWEDGPSVADMEAIKELYYFIPSYYESDPYADYGNWKDNAGTRPWREAYGAALGDCTNIDFSRTLSDEGRQQAEELAARIFANWSNGRGTFAGTLKEWVQLAEALGVKRNEYGGIDFYNAGMPWSCYANNDRTEDGHDVGDFYFSSVRRLIREKISIKPTEPKAKAPEFVPTYGPTYKAIKKALGQNVFFIYHKGTSSREEKELTIFEAAKILAAGGVVNLGHSAEYDGNPCIYATDRGGYKVQEKRNAKFAAVGITLAAPSWNVYGCVSVVGITPDTAAALRAELADIERQRKAWEAGQTADKATEKATRRTKGTKAGNNTTDTANDAQKATNEAAGVDMDAAPAEGLALVETAEGVAVIGDSRTTYRNRKAIKAHGGKWNRDAQQWQATDPDGVASLRAWFGAADDSSTPAADITTQESETTVTNAPESTQTTEKDNNTTNAPESAQNAQDAPESESKGNNNQDPDNDPDGTDPTPGKGSGAENGTAEPESIRYTTLKTSPNHQTAEENPAAALDYEEVTNPIKADDIDTPRVLRLSDRRDIVTGCNDEQHAELVAMGGKETAEGVTFRASKQNRHRLHVWQNEQTRKQRAAILGDGWQWATLERHGKEGDEICTTDGTRGTVTKSSPESICIEFETADGHTYSVAGHFMRTSPRYRPSEISPKPQTAEQNTADRLEIGTRVLCKHHGALGTVDDYNTRDGITTNYDPATGRERVGSLEYYDELLAAGWWGNDTRDFDFGNVQISVDAPEDRSRYYRDKWCVIIYEGDREAVTEWVHIRTLAALLAYYYEHRTTDQDTDHTPAKGLGQAAAAATDEETPHYKESMTSPNFHACEEKPARHSITASERQAYTDYYKQRISDSAACGFVQVFQWKTYRVEVHIDNRNDTDDPEGMAYRVIWFDNQKPQKIEGCVTLEQAARHIADFRLLCEIGLSLSDILNTDKWEVAA